jgi:hypothetical protein
MKRAVLLLSLHVALTGCVDRFALPRGCDEDNPCGPGLICFEERCSTPDEIVAQLPGSPRDGGFDAGLVDAGFEDAGFEDAGFEDAGFEDAGFDGGYDAGFDAGYDGGYDAGFDGGYDAGFDGGYDAGFDGGYDAGFDGGYDAGFDGGYDAGFDGGYDAGFDGGYDAGFDGGYDAGFDAGYDAGYDAGAPCPGAPPAVLCDTEDVKLAFCFDFETESGGVVDDGSAVDADGTLVGGAFLTAGRGGAVLAPSGGYLAIADGPANDFTAAATWALWANPNSDLSTDALLLDDNNEYAIRAYADESVECTSVHNTNVQRTRSAPGVLTAGAWTHIACTWDGVVRLYVDGVEVADSGAIAADMDNGNDDDVHLGAGSTAGDEPFDGLLDDVQVFGRALADAEICWYAQP